MPAKQKQTSPRGRAAGLSRESILDTALLLVERDGVDALSMRRLGIELGVDGTAFYRHFRDKDDLVLAAFDRASVGLAALTRDFGPEVGWRERLAALAMGSWELAAQRPAIFSLGFARITGGPAEREIVEFILATLSGTGLPPDQVVLHYRVFGDSTLGLCGTGATVAALTPTLREKDANAWSRIYAVLPQAEYPAARAHTAELGGVSEQAIYEGMVEAVLDRIERAVTEAAAGHQGSGRR